MYNEYIQQKSDNNISKSHFYKICKLLALKFKKSIKNLHQNPSTNNKRQYFMKNLIEYINDNNYLVCFFDVTSINDKSFKTKGWSLPNSQPKYNKKFTYNLTHIMCLMTIEGRVFFQCVKGTMINLDIIHFLNTIVNTIHNEKFKRKIIIILDNARMHKTEYFTRFVLTKNIKLLFTVSNHPMLNPIEYLFRFLKNPLRKENSLH